MSAPTKTSIAINRSDRDMSDSVPSRSFDLHPRPAPSRKIRIAADLGVSEAVADKYLYGERAANLIYTAIIESDLRAGDTQAVALWTAPAEAVQMGADVLSLAQAMAEYDAADSAEDVEQSKLNRKCCEMMSDRELEDYARKVAPEAYAALRCLAAIRAVQRERKLAR